jgi:hypothetical protein
MRVRVIDFDRLKAFERGFHPLKPLPCSRLTIRNRHRHQTTCSTFIFPLDLIRTDLVGAPNLAMANSRKELGLLAGTFLVGLGALEMVLHVFGL